MNLEPEPASTAAEVCDTLAYGISPLVLSFLERMRT